MHVDHELAAVRKHPEHGELNGFGTVQFHFQAVKLTVGNVLFGIVVAEFVMVTVPIPVGLDSVHVEAHLIVLAGIFTVSVEIDVN